MTRPIIEADAPASECSYQRFREEASRFITSHFGEKTADTVICLPDFVYMLCRLMGDPEVPTGRKLDFAFALLYIVSPIDLFPKSVPLLGMLDDVYAAFLAISKLVRTVDRRVLMRYWRNDPRILDNVRAWLRFLDDKFGSGLLKNMAAHIMG